MFVTCIATGRAGMPNDEDTTYTPTPEQNAAAFSGPAPGVNRFISSFGPTGLRIAFIEDGIDGAPHFRGAVTMHPQDGIKLMTMLQVVLVPFVDALAQVEERGNAKTE